MSQPAVTTDKRGRLKDLDESKLSPLTLKMQEQARLFSQTPKLADNESLRVLEKFDNQSPACKNNQKKSISKDIRATDDRSSLAVLEKVFMDAEQYSDNVSLGTLEAAMKELSMTNKPKKGKTPTTYFKRSNPKKLSNPASKYAKVMAVEDDPFVKVGKAFTNSAAEIAADNRIMDEIEMPASLGGVPALMETEPKPSRFTGAVNQGMTMGTYKDTATKAEAVVAGMAIDTDAGDHKNNVVAKLQAVLVTLQGACALVEEVPIIDVGNEEVTMLLAKIIDKAKVMQKSVRASRLVVGKVNTSGADDEIRKMSSGYVTTKLGLFEDIDEMEGLGDDEWL